ncbi:hypothetical protein CAOG_09096 [Capsaspora owczarzaki ATCC 30864]|uniref:Dehydrogenase/reductase SDR family member 4 n=1 Tax=Capsaspora owczarzaki (strain ATCC 30864) TaxID=595528 RepID=A0A0D2UPP8_CAPO3|nr:hypothetical protein CAOG_09096 [Capsaspora owczarzaki ATCC 30864]KJE96976.1 hypothetical protein CAOG_009096 [Capsaspora owczarzaki ATCC 30864]|eukprot:XP_011270753.1 hypothetical protein CAOG_09096 [Capsaspora owczarzaki ATCC 30864]
MITARAQALTTRLLQTRNLTTQSAAAPTPTPTPRRLEGRVAIVTASTDGIGFAIAKRFGDEGASVVVSSRRKENVDRAVAELKSSNSAMRVIGIVCHVAKAEDRKRLVQETLKSYGNIDILVSNAAVNPVFGSMLETDEAAWDKIFEVNVKSAFLLTKEVAPHLKPNRGSVVFVSSIGGFAPFEALGAYSVSKTALFGLTKALSRELGPRGVRVNCIAPGIIKTRFSEALWKNQQIADRSLETVPLGRFGTPEECASTVAFLASDDAAYVTGESIVASGGMQSRL